MRRASLFRPVPTLRTSAGPACSARADRSPSARRSAVLATSVSGPTSDRVSRAAMTPLTSSAARPTQPSTSQVWGWGRSSTQSAARTDASTSELAASTSRTMRTLMAGSRWGAELDSDPAHGVDVARILRRLPELAAQPRDVDVHRLVGPAVGHPPHVGEQIPPGDHLAGMQREVVQQVELPPAQVEGRAVQGRHVRVDVEPEPADLQRAAAAVARPADPAQHRPDPRLDPPPAERPDHAAVG